MPGTKSNFFMIGQIYRYFRVEQLGKFVAEAVHPVDPEDHDHYFGNSPEESDVEIRLKALFLRIFGKRERDSSDGFTQKFGDFGYPVHIHSRRSGFLIQLQFTIVFEFSQKLFEPRMMFFGLDENETRPGERFF